MIEKMFKMMVEKPELKMTTSIVKSRSLKKLVKPRPLTVNLAARNSNLESPTTVEGIMDLAETVASNIANGNYDNSLKIYIKSLHNVLKSYGSNLEKIYKDQLDRSFVAFRNGSRDESLDYDSRSYLLELIELRATQWRQLDTNAYYKYKCDIEIASTPTAESPYLPSPFFSQIESLNPACPVQMPQQLILGPGEVVKSSGKYMAPTRVAGKNYCKDEVVIRNSDSGKVMGIKGRRVHMIEELSETVVSFQRVNPGAKERLVQITGPTEDKINFAKQLIDDTIRRNASPVRTDADVERASSNCSLTDSEDGMLQHSGPRLMHSFSTNDASLSEYKYTVTVGEESIKITGANLDLVRMAKLVLDEYFTPTPQDGGQEVFETYATGQEVDVIGAAGSEALTENTEGRIFESLKELSIEPQSPITISSGLRYYTPQEIIYYLDSPLSRQLLDNWASVVRDYPSILRKTPIEWFDSATILKNFKTSRSSPVRAHDLTPTRISASPVLVD